MSGSRFGWFRRRSDAGPLYLERLRAVELPLITETKRRVLRGDVPGALRYCYPLVLEDLSKAYGVAFPEEWTHEEILRHGIPPGAGPVGEFLPRLYRLYAEARYSPSPAMTESEGREAIDLLHSVYSVAPMWRLYAWHKPSALDRLFPPRTPAPPSQEAEPATPPETSAPEAS